MNRGRFQCRMEQGRLKGKGNEMKRSDTILYGMIRPQRRFGFCKSRKENEMRINCGHIQTCTERHTQSTNLANEDDT